MSKSRRPLLFLACALLLPSFVTPSSARSETSVLHPHIVAAMLGRSGGAFIHKLTMSEGRMRYRGGPVMNTATTHVIYWLPPGRTLMSDGQDSELKSRVESFFGDVGGTSYYNILTQYSVDGQGYDVQNGPILNTSSFGGSYVDTTPYPHAGTADDPLTADDIGSAVRRALRAKEWHGGLDQFYMVFTAAGVNRDSTALAWHGVAVDGVQPVILAYVKLQSLHDYCSTCTGDVNRQYANDTIFAVSHEFFEAVTDPLGNGWSGSSGEIADVCESGTYLADRTGEGLSYNVTLKGNPYKAFPMWSNLDGGCVFNSDHPVPPRNPRPTLTPTPTVTPTAIPTVHTRVVKCKKGYHRVHGKCRKKKKAHK